tara:strand:- start:189 stop:389 length:201 start_codon:yes stop_codon:yes gene_type:complete
MKVMSRDKIIFETVETIIDSIYDVVEENMFNYSNYEDGDDKFEQRREEIVSEVIEELNNRILNMNR